jgi:hypothetical protein
MLENEKSTKGKRKRALPICARHPRFTYNLNPKIYSSRDIKEDSQSDIGRLLETYPKHYKVTFEDPMKYVYHPKVNEFIGPISLFDVISLLKRDLLSWGDVSIFSEVSTSKIKSGMVDSSPGEVLSDDHD